MHHTAEEGCPGTAEAVGVECPVVEEVGCLVAAVMKVEGCPGVLLPALYLFSVLIQDLARVLGPLLLLLLKTAFLVALTALTVAAKTTGTAAGAEDRLTFEALLWPILTWLTFLFLSLEGFCVSVLCECVSESSKRKKKNCLNKRNFIFTFEMQKNSLSIFSIFLYFSVVWANLT